MKASIISETERLLLFVIVLSLMHQSASARYFYRPVVGPQSNSNYEHFQDLTPPNSQEILYTKRSEPFSPIFDQSTGNGPPQHRNSAEDNFLGLTRKYTWFKKKNSATKFQQFAPDYEGKRHLSGGPRKEILFRQCYFNPISCF